MAVDATTIEGIIYDDIKRVEGSSHRDINLTIEPGYILNRIQRFSYLDDSGSGGDTIRTVPILIRSTP